MKNFSKKNELQNSLLNRFIMYTKVWTESDEEKADKGIMPSTPQQKNLAESLSGELKLLGLSEVVLTKECYVYGFLPASKGFEQIPSVCFLAHIDTSGEVSGKNVKPIVHPMYDGAKIDLNAGVVLNTEDDEYLALAARNNETIITSDGNTLLGADDKAGIAEIVSCLEFYKNNPKVKHGPIEVIFSPDEETGHGMDKVPLNLLKAKFAYTLDGGHIGELETECFNAYGVTLVFKGNSTHTGSAKKGGMVNAINAASTFVNSIPAKERPETTENYEGFYAVMEMSGTIEKSSVSVLLRDFSLQKIKERLEKLKVLAQSAAISCGAEVFVDVKEQYKNMKQKLDENPEVVENLRKDFAESGVPVVEKPIRGGTDGSRLTEMGIPTPNIFTGGHNFHSRKEWASLQQMSAACDVILSLVDIIKNKDNK